MRIGRLSVVAICVLGSSPFALPAGAEEKARVGVYDSRAIALAYWTGERIDEHITPLCQGIANASGDEQREKELRRKLLAHRWLRAKQTLCAAPVDDVLEHIKKELPNLKRLARIQAIISKWDKKALSRHKTTELVDITLLLVAEFGPPKERLQDIWGLPEHPQPIVTRYYSVTHVSASQMQAVLPSCGVGPCEIRTVGEMCFSIKATPDVMDMAKMVISATKVKSQSVRIEPRFVGTPRALPYPPSFTLEAAAKRSVFNSGRPLPISITLSNQPSMPVSFTTFSTEPNEWNGETHNISLVSVYRDGEKRNLHLSHPEVQVPRSVTNSITYQVKPDHPLRIMLDVSKWKIEGDWVKGEYRLVFRMERVRSEYKTWSDTWHALSDPITIRIE